MSFKHPLFFIARVYRSHSIDRISYNHSPFPDSNSAFSTSGINKTKNIHRRDNFIGIFMGLCFYGGYNLSPSVPTHVPIIKENTRFHGDLYKNSHILFSRNQNDKEHTQVYLMSVHTAQYTFIWTLYYCIQHIFTHLLSILICSLKQNK